MIQIKSPGSTRWGERSSPMECKKCGGMLVHWKTFYQPWKKGQKVEPYSVFRCINGHKKFENQSLDVIVPAVYPRHKEVK